MMYDTSRLEFDRVLNLLRDRCISDCSKEMVMHLRPASDPESARAGFNLLQELEKASDMGYEPGIEHIHDTRGLLRKSRAPNSWLTGEELKKIENNISTFRSVRKLFRSIREEVPGLARLTDRTVPADLQDRIRHAIDAGGAVRDNASGRLSEIASDLKGLRNVIEEILEGYFNSPEMSRYLQERHVTLKDDRYVIPVKHNYRGRIKGIVHAQSGSEKTLFVEPFSIVDRNNEIRLLVKEREREVRSLLVLLTSHVNENGNDLLAVQDALVQLDIFIAKKNFKESFGCTIPEFSEERLIRIEGGRHPLLSEPVPVDFRITAERCGVVITGPNTGGKTVTLKMIGLFVVMALSSIPVPARVMKTYFFSSVYCDIGDEGSIEQSLSTFSGHIKNIKTFTDKADGDSLVLIDELGAGTDPVEGGALGAAVLDHLMDKKIITVVTTHFGFIKMYALGSDRSEVASVEFDPVTCRPTYRLMMGIPGRSNALEIAEFLGLEPSILSKTREYLSDEDRSADLIFKNLALMEKELDIKRRSVEDTRYRLEKRTDEYARRMADVESRERAVQSEYRRRFSSLFEEYRKSLESSIREIRERGASKESVSRAREKERKMEEEVARIVEETPSAGIHNGPALKPLEIGDRATYTGEDGRSIEGRIAEINGETVTLQGKNVRIAVDRGGVQSLGKRKKSRGGDWDFTAASNQKSIYECDIRGMRYDEAMDEVTRFLDAAVLNGTKTFSIIHGLGTGVLREGVRKALEKNTDVERFEYARPEQGGYGCTLVTMKA